jgi:type IV secretory pathway TraG/TraD family ATPase VirD4
LFGFQNKNQLEDLYGAHVTRTILSNCSTKLVYRTPEPQTAEYMAQMLGSQEVLESNESLSMGAHHMRDGVSIAHQRRLQPIVSASEIMALNKLEAYVSLPGNYPVAKLTFAIVM